MKKELKIRLADTNIVIYTDNEYLFKMCQNYAADFELSDFTVEANDCDIAYEAERYEERNQRLPSQSILRRNIFESLAVYRKIAEKMIERNTVLFHGSAIAVDGICYLFCADSGTGKSTHTRLWKEHFKQRAVMINDDKPLIRIKDTEVRVFGTPWSGKHHLDTNSSALLKAVCFLERGDENHIWQISEEDVLPALLRYSYRPSDPVHLQADIGLLLKMSQLVSFYRLQCNMDPSAGLISYEGMNSKDTGDIHG